MLKFGGIAMLAAVQGVIENDMIRIDGNVLKPFNGRSVTIIINENFNKSGSKQDKTAFFNAVGKIQLDRNVVDEYRSSSMI